MAFQILLNLIIAVIWMFMGSDWTLPAFIVGYLIGCVFVGALHRFWPEGFYMRRVWAILKLTVMFMKELVLSSILVIRCIISPKMTFRPGIFAFKTKLDSDLEITLLSSLICLTPGTLIMEVAKERQTLYIHAMDIQDAEMVSKHIRETFEKAIMEVTRPC